jgi:Amt family ammonium transporter
VPQLDTGDTAWLLASAALVMFMTPGLAFFYGGLVRAKNVLGTMMQSFIALAVVTVLWVLVGYTLAFGPDKGGLIGGLDFIGLRDVGAAPSPYAPTVPATAFMVFQLMFAIITPALIAGAFAERMKFSGYLMFIGLWSILVYAPVAHWEWGGGFLGANGVGALDFAGGAVVHANAGAAALATAIYLGKRRGHGSEDMSPHNIPFVLLGAGILWFGWFGFNAGSALASNALASSAFVNTQLGAAAAVLGWIIGERLRNGKATSIGAATGAVAGLATITPAAGYVQPLAALVIGLAAGFLCFVAVGLKGRLGYDDSLDVVGVHMVGGVLGVLLTGAFASLAINASGAAASPTQVGKQAVLAAVTVAFSFAATMVILKLTDLTVGLRVTDEHEEAGLDASQHGELGYRF